MSRLRVGLTGGIGSGKTTVAALFAAHGATVIDADRIGREMTARGGSAVAALRAEFGDTAIGADGGLDRGWMRQRVFSDPATKLRLERLLHPLIRAAMRAEADRAATAYVVLEIPLLIESGSPHDRVDRVLVVDSPRALQLVRVARRSGLSDAQTQAILAHQASRAERLAAADDVVVNAGEPAALAARIARLDRLYSALARER